MKPHVIATFDGSFDGFLCVVYAYYYDKINPILIQPKDEAQLTLECEVYDIKTEPDKTARVLNGISEKISGEASARIYYAFLSCERDRYMTIFNYIRLGFKLGHMIDSHLQEDCVRAVHKMYSHVGREAHLLHGFSRFEEIILPANQACGTSFFSLNTLKTQDQDRTIFYCVITPKNNALPLLVHHFCQRFMNQRWIIHDKNRNQAAIYNGETAILTNVPKDFAITHAPHEKQTQDMWAAFFKALTIKERINPKVQRQLLPLYFRKNMTEFKP